MVGALGRNLPMIEHDDLIGRQHAADALGDHEGSAIGQMLIKCSMDFGFGLHIDGAGAVIQNQDAR